MRCILAQTGKKNVCSLVTAGWFCAVNVYILYHACIYIYQSETSEQGYVQYKSVYLFIDAILHLI